MRLNAPGAPAWGSALARDIERGLRDPFDHPIRLQSFAAAADLPAAADWRWGIVALEDINMVAVSDGANWRRLDTGATL